MSGNAWAARGLVELSGGAQALAAAHKRVDRTWMRSRDEPELSRL